MTVKIAIANAKGGVAKTTTALSLSAAFAEEGKTMLAVDLDPHANLTISLGYKPTGLAPTIADVFLGDCQIQDAIYATEVELLSLIPSNHTLTMAENHLMVRDRYQLILSEALSNLNGFDIIMLDCPPTLGTLTQNALSAANILIIPAQPEYYSAHALRDMLNLILAIRPAQQSQAQVPNPSDDARYPQSHPPKSCKANSYRIQSGCIRNRDRNRHAPARKPTIWSTHSTICTRESSFPTIQSISQRIEEIHE